MQLFMNYIIKIADLVFLINPCSKGFTDRLKNFNSNSNFKGYAFFQD